MSTTSPARATLLVTTLFVGGLLVGATTGVAAVARAQDAYAHLDLFARVFSAIERDYVDPIPPEVLVEGAIEGMVRKLDRQSRWLSARQMQNLQEDTEGASTGIGVEVMPTDDGVRITSVLPGSPAGRQGLSTGDRILEIDGTSLAGLTSDEIEKLVHGARGDAATLTVLPEGAETPREVRTVHDRTSLQNVEAALIDGVIYARLVQFRQGCGFELEQAKLHSCFLS